MEQTKVHIEISNQIMRIDTAREVFDLRQIDNRRFMFSAQSGELILGAQYRSRYLRSSHAQEHAQSGAAAAQPQPMTALSGGGLEQAVNTHMA